MYALGFIVFNKRAIRSHLKSDDDGHRFLGQLFLQFDRGSQN